MTLDRAAIRAAARETLGHRTLLPGQADAVAAVTDGRDTLALLPTGGGKSAIYQLAGMSIDGPTLVVSPLIALQQDQLASIEDLGLVGGAVNSAVPRAEREAALDAFGRGDLEFLLAGPETLADPDVLARLAAARPSLLVVDEAHCVAEWGSDFRPEYRRLAAVAEALGRPPVLALTATASPLVRAEIVERLGLRDPVVVARGFDRPNLELSVELPTGAEGKSEALAAWVAATPGPGIVYAATRGATTALAERLASAGVRAEAYHAGLGARRRAEVQDRFMASTEGVIVATIAFGMGIDKADVRFVAHADPSESLDAYHQEIGRAGRDGQPAVARLFYRAEDLGLRRFQAAPARIDEGDVRAVLRGLRRSAAAPDVARLAAAAGRSRRKTDAVIGRLEEEGVVAVSPDGTITLLEPDAHAGGEREPAALAAPVVAAQERRRLVERSRVEMMRGYAEAPGCRRAFLLGYFGEPFEPPCGRCDRCLGAGAASTAGRATGAPAGREATPGAPAPVAVGARVLHATFGAGSVTAADGERVTVAFDRVGYRTLAAASVAEDGVLVTAPRGA